jgi:hypothetical protein
VDDDVRFGRFNVPRVKAPRTPSVLSHETTRSLDFGIKSCELVRDWGHGVWGYLFRLLNKN